MIPKPELGKPVEEVLGGDAADQVAPGGGRGNPHVRGRGRDVKLHIFMKEGSGRGVRAPAGVGKRVLDAFFFKYRFCYKRFMLDLLVGLFYNLMWWANRDRGDCPVELCEIMSSTWVMLIAFYMVEDFKDAPAIAAIQTTLLVVPWANYSSLSWDYYHTSYTLCAIAIQGVCIALVTAIYFYMSVVMPVDVEERQKNTEKNLIQSAISILFWATFFYLVGMGKMVGSMC